MKMVLKTPIFPLLIYAFIDGFSCESARLLAELEIADLELADMCEDLSKGMKLAILDANFKDKISTENAYGHLLRVGSNNFRKFEDVPGEVERNWTFFVKPGDGLLPKEDWDTLVSYHNANEELVSVVKVPCLNDTDGCIFTKAEFQSILKNNRELDLLNGTWFAWQHVFNPKTEQYPAMLNLLKKAAALNEQADVTSYWEYLNDFSGAYSTAREFWQQIEPLYVKLHGFLKTRLDKYYNLNDTAEIPVYLLGSNFGTDWSYVADIVLPHPQLHYDVESYLKYTDLQTVYSLAENLTTAASLGRLGDGFWSNSNFNMTFCGPQILSYCSQEYSEVYDCDTPTWTAYLDAHEAAFRIALRNQDYGSLMRQNLRYSAIDEAIGTLGSLLAIESLNYHGIVNQDFADAEESVQMTKLLLTALRVLPRLPYYLAADEWRLQELESPSKDISATWWQLRKKYQRVTGVTGAESDFLRDKFLTSNKPYLSKFFGDILAFQFLDYYQKQVSDPGSSVVEEIGLDPNFLSMIKDRPTSDWQYLLSVNYGLEFSPLALLEHFQPLVKYLDAAPLEQAPIVTTTTTTSTTTTTTTTAAPELLKSKIVKKEKSFERIVANDTTLNDEAERSNVTKVSDKAPSAASSTAMYVGVGLLVLVSCVTATVLAYNRVRRRRRTNNRRFAS